jgi:hypothetical protein
MDDFAETRDITVRSNNIENAGFGAMALASTPDGPAVSMRKCTTVNHLITRLGSTSDFPTAGGTRCYVDR